MVSGKMCKTIREMRNVRPSLLFRLRQTRRYKPMTAETDFQATCSHNNTHKCAHKTIRFRFGGCKMRINTRISRTSYLNSHSINGKCLLLWQRERERSTDMDENFNYSCNECLALEWPITLHIVLLFAFFRSMHAPNQQTHRWYGDRVRWVNARCVGNPWLL